MCKMCMSKVLDGIHPCITITYNKRHGLEIIIFKGCLFLIHLHRKKSAYIHTILGNANIGVPGNKILLINNITPFLDSEPRENNIKCITSSHWRRESGNNWLSNIAMLTSFISNKINDGLYKKIIELFCLPSLKWEFLSYKLYDIVTYHDLSSSHVKLYIKIDSDINKLKIDLIYNRTKYKNRQRVIKDTLEKFIPYDIIHYLFLFLDWW